MVKINPYYQNLVPNYLFRDIAAEIKKVRANNPSAKIISLGIGDVTKPIPSVCVQALKQASDEMGAEDTMKGYGPDYGYDFLIKAIIENDYLPYGIDISADEVFISDGAKCDVGNVQEIFSDKAKVCIPDPVYPVYRDSNIMAGREITFVPCLEENGFMPSLPKDKQDIIYLCSPNNPTGTVMSKAELKKWVDYALQNDAVIIFDSAYKEFIADKSYPSSIYEIEGAKQVAIESRSFSKTAGFTGVRCGYMVVPKELKGLDDKGKVVSLRDMWARRMSTKYNGNSYMVQRAAEAVFSDKGKAECRETIAYYMENAKLLKQGLQEMGFTVYGGENAPYIWFKVKGVSSADFFAKLLNSAFVVCTPGSGFGKCGEGFVRLTAFGKRQDIVEALERIKRVI